jgi:N-acetylglutamate synthase-like GNAT family acetyltransferase
VIEIASARRDDMPVIEEAVERMRLDAEDLAVEQFIVAREDGQGKLLGFGRIKPYGNGVFELGSVGVMEDARGRGVGERLVKELIARFPSEEIYITTDLVDYFMRFGFSMAASPPKVIVEKVNRVCSSLRSGVVPMTLRRRRP